MGSVFLWRKVLKWPAYAKRSMNAAFNRHLFATNVGISLTLSGLGDFLQQQHNIVIKKQKKWDVVRTRQLTCTGVTVGALCHHWYNLLDKKLPGRALNIAIKKLLVDQLLFSPVCLTVFFISFGIFKGGDWDDFFHDLEHRGLKLYTAEWFVWPPAQLINFYWLPTKYRVLYDNTISLIFDVYTSHVCYDIDITKETMDKKDDDSISRVDR